MPVSQHRFGTQSTGQTGNKRATFIFIGLALLLGWLAALPLWLGEGLATPGAIGWMLLMMFTPTFAALVMIFFVEKPARKAEALGLTPLRPASRLMKYLALALSLPILFSLASLPIGALLGVYPADFLHFSGFEQQVQQQLSDAGITGLELPVGVLVASQFLNIIIAAVFINLVPALGEEIGWRGWLLPKLVHLGPWPAILISGVVWGVWHAPVILLGYNYPSTPSWLAMLCMIVFCTVLGGIFGWLRLRGGSVWPTALAHSCLNASAGLSLVFVQAGEEFDPVHAGITGWTGWIVPAALLIVLVWGKHFRTGTPAPKTNRTQ